MSSEDIEVKQELASSPGQSPGDIAGKRIVVVLGMHRSGTSAITHALETMGVSLGDHLMPAAAGNNEKGFFEDLEINAINVDLLKTFGKDWHSLGPIGAAELTSDKVTGIRLRAISLLRSRFQHADVFAFKDPRTCRLLPFWQQVFQHLQLEDSYVVALRNPLSVARSLQQRDGLGEEKSYYLWLLHMLPSALLTGGKPRLVMDYDQLVQKPESEIRRMADALRLRNRLDAARLSTFSEQFLEERLRHAVFKPEDSAIDPRVPVPVLQLFNLLNDLARQAGAHGPAEAEALLRDLAARIDGVTQVFAFIGQHEQAIAELQRIVHDKQVHIVNIEAGYKEVSEHLKAKADELANLGKLVHDKDVHIGHIEAGYREVTEQLKAKAGEIATLGKLVHDKDVHIGHIEAGYKEVTEQLKARAAEIATLGQLVRDKDVHIGNLSAAVAEKGAVAERLAKALDDSRHSTEALTQQIASAQGEAARLAQAVQDKDVHIANLGETIDRLHAHNALLNHRAATQRNSLSWKLAKPARAIWGVAWRLGAQRPVELVPFAHVKRTAEGWRAEGPNAQFLLQTARAWHGLSGWHMLELRVRVSESCNMALHFDVASGLPEVLRVPVAVDQSTVQVPIFVPVDCVSVRLHPCEREMDFELTGCHIKKLAQEPAVAEQAGTYERLGGRTGNAARLEPVSGLSALQAGTEYGWTADHGDPHFKVIVDTKLAPGWYMVEMLIHARLDAGAAKLYFDYGAGYSEADSVLLPFRSGVLTKRLVRLDQVPLQIRFDPIERQGRFSVTRLNFARVWQWFARDRMFRRLQNHVGEFKGRPRGEVEAQLRAEAKALGKSLDDVLLANYGATYRTYGGAISYAEWIEGVERTGLPAPAEVQRMMADMTPKLLFSVIVPTYNTNPDHLRACIDSVCRQSYPNWELCIADDASSQPHVAEILRGYAARDARIKICYRPQNGHISRASNSALEMATGDFVALLDHDDELAEHALFFVAEAIQRNRAAQILYSDEDKLDDRGNRVDPHFKSDWNPDLFYAQNYVSHLGVYRRELLAKIGGFRPGVEGSQDQDLLLRCLPHVRAEDIVHIPRVLYHWRSVAGSTALDSGEKSYTEDAGLRALRDYFDAQGSPGVQLESAALPNSYRVRWPLPDPAPLASLIIPTRDRRAITEVAVRSILEKTTYPNFEILIVDNGSVEPDTLQFFEDIQKEDPRVRVLRYDHPFNYSAINNFAERHARGEILGLVNNDVEVISPEWLTEMVSHACRPEIGCVGAKLYYSNDTLQHAGVILGLGGVAGHSHKNAPRHSMGYYGRLQLVQSLSAVTAACLVVRREIYRAVGGLDEKNLVVAFNDVDFCLRVRDAGYRNLWTPYAELYHHESISRGAEDSPEKLARFQAEIQYMVDTWQDGLAIDPYYNPNLTPDREDFSIDSVQR